MSLTSDLRCPRASHETGARAKLSEETSEHVSGLVVPRPGGPVSCLQKGACWSEAPFRGPSQEVFCLTPLYSQESFFWSLSPIFFVLS